MFLCAWWQEGVGTGLVNKYKLYDNLVDNNSHIKKEIHKDELGVLPVGMWV